MPKVSYRIFDYLSIILGLLYAQGFIQDFSIFRKPAAAPTSQLETVPFTNVLTARIHLWKN